MVCSINRAWPKAGWLGFTLCAVAATPPAWNQQALAPAGVPPRITHVAIAPLTPNAAPEILVCDAGRNSVLSYKRTRATWTERVLASGIPVPAHAAPVDIDGDKDLDVIVADLGDLLPCDELVGQVILLENHEGAYRSHVLLSDEFRIADVQPADLDGDGDVDLAVAAFGYAHGHVLWLEQIAPRQFVDHHLLDRPGVVHVPVGDYDRDGDLDIAAVASQDEEEVWIIENLGQAKFENRRVWFTHNFDAGSGGLVPCDLDRDGDLDFLLPQGDNLENGYGWAQPYHGCLWLENRGDLRFQPHRIATFGGAYAAVPGDLDQDKDVDVVLVSMSNNWSVSENPSVVWLENDGLQNFKLHPLDFAPLELITAAVGDLDGDQKLDVVAGSLHLPSAPAHDRLQRLTVWLTGSPPTANSRSAAPAAHPLLEPAVLQELAKIEQAAQSQGDWLRFAEVCRAYGLLHRAEAAYERAHALAPLSGEALLAWAVTAGRMGHFAQAEALYVKVQQEKTPAARDATLALAKDALRQEKPGRAEAHLRSLENDAEAALWLSRLLIRTGRAQEAVTLLDRWLPQFHDDLKIRQLKSWAEAELGHHEIAERHRLIAFRCRDWRPHGDPFTMRDSFLRAQFGSAALDAASQLAEAQADSARAIASLREAQSRAWSEHRSRKIATLQLRAGHAAEAILTLEDAISTTGQSVELLELLGDAQWDSGGREQAVRTWRLATQSRAGRTPISNISLRQKLLRAAEPGPGGDAERREQQAQLSFELGKSAFLNNDLRGAFRQIWEAVALKNQFPSAWYYLAEISEFGRDPEGAQIGYRRCLEQQATHGRALAGLQRLKRLNDAPAQPATPADPPPQ